MFTARGKPRKYQSPHGMSGTPEYSAWIRRKAQGVLCEEWSKEFLAFYFEVGCRPSKKHILVRINPVGEWGPGNVEWSSPEQELTRREALNRAYAAYKERVPVANSVVYSLSCPKCGIQFFTKYKQRRYCSEKCKAADYYFLRQFRQPSSQDR